MVNRSIVRRAMIITVIIIITTTLQQFLQQVADIEGSASQSRKPIFLHRDVASSLNIH